MDKEKSVAVDKLVTEISKYMELKFDYYRISSLEKAAAVSSNALIMILVALFLFFSFVFLNIFIAVSISYWFQSPPLGFGIFLGVYLLLTLLLIIFWNPLKKFIFNRFVDAILVSVDEEEEGDENK